LELQRLGQPPGGPVPRRAGCAVSEMSLQPDFRRHGKAVKALLQKVEKLAAVH
jgi:hypothetical protein